MQVHQLQFTHHDATRHTTASQPVSQSFGQMHIQWIFITLIKINVIDWKRRNPIPNLMIIEDCTNAWVIDGMEGVWRNILSLMTLTGSIIPLSRQWTVVRTPLIEVDGSRLRIFEAHSFCERRYNIMSLMLFFFWHFCSISNYFFLTECVQFPRDNYSPQLFVVQINFSSPIRHSLLYLSLSCINLLPDLDFKLSKFQF